MDSSKDEVDHQLLDVLKVYKDGRIERIMGAEIVPPSIDPQNGVSSKDVTIQEGLSARLFIPKDVSKEKKLPLLIYFHGGGFVYESAFSKIYHNHLSSLVHDANIVAVSVEYGLAPEHPIPACYEDSWNAIKWVASHSKGEGEESWIRDYVNFDRIFLGGDSAGANICHNMIMRDEESGLKFYGAILVHPYFWGEKPIGGEESNPTHKDYLEQLWLYACQSTRGLDDPQFNPAAKDAPSLENFGCTKVLIIVAGSDLLRGRGYLYYEMLKKSGWGGAVDIMETEGEGHIFHLFDPDCDKAVYMLKRVVNFINQDN